MRFKSDWVASPRAPAYADLDNIAKDMGYVSCGGSWSGDIDGGGHALSNLASVTAAAIHAAAGEIIIDPSHGLHVGSLDVGNYAGRGSDANIGVYSGNLLLQCGLTGFTGSVGIGTTSPNAILEVFRANAGTTQTKQRWTGGNSPANYYLDLIENGFAGSGDMSWEFNGRAFNGGARSFMAFLANAAGGFVIMPTVAVATYANNAAAVSAGLTVGTLYRITGTDTPGIVH